MKAIKAWGRRAFIWWFLPKAAMIVAVALLGKALGSTVFMVALLVLVVRFIHKGMAENYHLDFEEGMRLRDAEDRLAATVYVAALPPRQDL